MVRGLIASGASFEQASIRISKPEQQRFATRLVEHRQRLGLTITYGNGLQRHQQEVLANDEARSEGVRQGKRTRAAKAEGSGPDDGAKRVARKTRAANHRRELEQSKA